MSISDLNIVHTEYTEYTEWFIDDNTTNKRNHRICRKLRYDGWRDEDKITERKVLSNKSEADEWTSRQAGTVKHVPFCGIQRQRDVLSDERKSVDSVDSVWD